jgi:hypothetical protein
MTEHISYIKLRTSYLLLGMMFIAYAGVFAGLSYYNVTRIIYSLICLSIAGVFLYKGEMT